MTGTRVRVRDVLDMLAGGAAEQEILDDFPYLSSQDVRACLLFAAETSSHPIVAA